MKVALTYVLNEDETKAVNWAVRKHPRGERQDARKKLIAESVNLTPTIEAYMKSRLATLRAVVEQQRELLAEKEKELAEAEEEVGG